MIKSILGLEILSLKSFITRYTPLYEIPSNGVDGGPNSFMVAHYRPSQLAVHAESSLPEASDYASVESKAYDFSYEHTLLASNVVDSFTNPMTFRAELSHKSSKLLIKGAILDARGYLDKIKGYSEFNPQNLQTQLATLLQNGAHLDNLKLVRIAPKRWTILDISLFRLYFSEYLLRYTPNPLRPTLSFELSQPYRLVVMKEYLMPNRILVRLR